MYGIYHMINEIPVTSPDDEVWEPVSMGVALTAEQKRSLWRRLTWVKNVVDEQRLDWFTYDNTILTSLVTRKPDSLRQSEVYTDAICQSVSMRHRHGVGVEYTAIFLVKVD
jgi:hypothetical protein